MKYERALAITYRYFLLVRGNWTRAFQIFIWGAIDIVLWGFITRYLDSVGGQSVNFTTVFLGAVILWEFVTRAQQGVSSPFLEDIWSRNLLNLFGSPLSVGEYLFGLLVTSILTSIAGFAVLVLFAAYAFGFPLWSIGLPVLAFLGILFIFGSVLGVVAISILLRFGPSAEWFVWPIPAILSPFVGVFYPVSVLPVWMQSIAHVLPVSYVFENLRSLSTEGTFSSSELLLATGLDFVLLGAACLLFVYIHRRALQSGAIARFSAESYSG